MEEDKSCHVSIRKKLFQKKMKILEYILLLNVLPMHHQSASDHALDSVENL